VVSASGPPPWFQHRGQRRRREPQSTRSVAPRRRWAARGHPAAPRGSQPRQRGHPARDRGRTAAVRVRSGAALAPPGRRAVDGPHGSPCSHRCVAWESHY